MEKNLVKTTDSQQMDQLYTAGLLHPSREVSRESARPAKDAIQEVARTVQGQIKEGKKEVLLLQRWNGKIIAEDFHLPEMEIEIERAVEQVETAMKKTDEAAAQAKSELDDSRSQHTTKVDKAER